jgi:hypothetical protein
MPWWFCKIPPTKPYLGKWDTSAKVITQYFLFDRSPFADPYPNPDLFRILKVRSRRVITARLEKYWRCNGQIQSGVTAIWREIAHLTIIGSGSGHFSDPKIGSRCVTCRARNRIQIFKEAASNA